MENNNFNYKPNIISRIGCYIDIQKHIIKQFGIKVFLRHKVFQIKNMIFKLVYNNSKRYREHIKNKWFENSLIKEFVFTSIMNKDHRSFQEYYNSLSEENKIKFKEEFIEKKDEMINFVIKDCKVTSEQDLDVLYNYFNIKFDNE